MTIGEKVDGRLREHLRLATADPERLETVGAELQASGHTLLEVLAALPPTIVPVDIAAIATGYLATQSATETSELRRVRAELERRRAELAALHRVNAVATSSLDEQTVLSKVVCAVAEVMGVDVCSIYLLQGPNQLVLGATCGLNPLAVGTARLLVGEGLTGWAAEQRQTVAVANIWSDARAKYVPGTEEDPYHSLLSVPITETGGEQILGVLNVQTKEPRQFTPDEITFLEMVAGELGLAIENARSYERTDEQLRLKVHALTTLRQVVVAVASSLDLRRVLNTVARHTLGLCQAERSVIFARKGQQLRIEAQCGEEELPAGERVEAAALAAVQQGTHQLVTLPDAEGVAARGVLCLPLRGHGSTYGALAIYGHPGQRFDPETVELITDFACEAALAIENAQLHQATQQSLEAKSVLLSELHHRVKNNLQTVASLLSLALRHSKTEEAADTLRESYNRVRSIAGAHDLLSRQAIGVTTVGEVARKVIELIEPTMQGRTKIRFATEGETIEVETREATTVAILLNELLTNAVRHGLKGKEVGTVRVSYGRQGSQIWVTVADDGHGLPPDFTLNKNKGLGLSIVRTLVEADLHGQVDCTGEHGARFTLLFPQPSSPRGEARAVQPPAPNAATARDRA